MYDIIDKKKNGEALTEEEIRFFIDGYTGGDIPDYQASALCMAICFRGMNDEETAALTLAMAHSGDTVDLSRFGSKTVDKHSTGGVGDKTTLIVAPTVAALGGVVAKMSGRGLGHTGGTVDKLESIPGFRTEISPEEFMNCAEKAGIVVAGQSGNLAPADKKLYALRDVTATVGSIPLIASSIMSKKLAAGSGSIVLDVKVGSGAFMKGIDEARTLAEKMVAIGKSAGRKMCAVLTDMDIPLGIAVGNALEVKEAIEVLNGKGPEDLISVCTELASHMVSLISGKSAEACQNEVRRVMTNGEALEKLALLVRSQGGEDSYIYHPEKFETAACSYDVKADFDGYVSHMNAEKIGEVNVILGAGREKKGDVIDPAAGLFTLKKTGDYVRRGETIATLFTNRKDKLELAEAMYRNAIQSSDKKPDPTPLIYGTVK